MGFLRQTSPSCIHLTGYGMVTAMCEEVQSPEREVPKAIVLSVAVAGVAGVILCDSHPLRASRSCYAS